MLSYLFLKIAPHDASRSKVKKLISFKLIEFTGALIELAIKATGSIFNSLFLQGEKPVLVAY